MARASRQQAEARGRRGERLAVWVLRLKGYRILGERVKTPVGEIDIVASRRNVVCFVEVKARTRRDDAIGAVSERNWQRIADAAGLWMMKHPQYAFHGWRYDLIAIATGKFPIHLKDAWRPDSSL